MQNNGVFLASVTGGQSEAVKEIYQKMIREGDL